MKPPLFFSISSLLVVLSLGSASAQMTDVLTYHNDLGRTGQALHEEVLRPANVVSNHFGKLWVLATDGKVDAEPLYAAGVNIPGRGVKNVVFIETEHGSSYAFDADSTNLFWKASMIERICATGTARSTVGSGLPSTFSRMNWMRATPL